MEIQKVFLTSEFNSLDKETPFNTHTDVIVELQNNEKFIASFFTFQNITNIQQDHIKSGEFLRGKYFWSRNMILIDRCTRENVMVVIKHLIEEGDFPLVFQKLN
ncbi:MAG: hypothetical protein AAF587_36210 [Bacteroidota bacterium]